MRSSYISGYLKALEKCAQFNWDPYSKDTPMYYRISEEDQKNIERRLHNLSRAQMKFDKRKWYDLFGMLSDSYQVGHNERELERAKRLAAINAAANEDPVDWYTMKALGQDAGFKYMRVDPDRQRGYGDVRNALIAGMDDYNALYYLTRDARKARQAWDASEEGQAAAKQRRERHHRIPQARDYLGARAKDAWNYARWAYKYDQDNHLTKNYLKGRDRAIRDYLKQIRDADTSRYENLTQSIDWLDPRL